MGIQAFPNIELGKVVDFHVHLAPSFADHELPGLGVSQTSEGQYVFDGHTVDIAALYRPEDLGEFLTGNGVDLACVSVPPPFYRQGLDEQVAGNWVSALNTGIVTACAADDRLLPLAYLPLEHPELAVATARGCMGLDEFAGWTASAGGGSAALDAPELGELWALLAADGRPLLLHPGTTRDARMGRHYLDNLLGNPVETGLAAAQLVFGGVLGAQPNLRVILVHGGGVVPSVAGRWQRGQDTDRPGINITAGTVVGLLRQLYADCLVHDPAALALVERTFGSDKLVLGSDWPFPMGLADPYHALRQRPARFTTQVAATNAAKLLTPVT